MPCELLLLEPRAAREDREKLRDDVIAYFLLNGIDFAFNRDNTLPRELPADWRDYRAVLIWLEDFDHYREALAEFPSVGPEVAIRREGRFEYPPLDLRHPNGRTLLCIRSLPRFNQSAMEDLFWRADLTIMHPNLKRRLLALSDEFVVERFLANFDRAREPHLRSVGPGWRLDMFRCEQNNLVKKLLFEYDALVGAPRLRQVAVDMAEYFLAHVDPDDPLLCGDLWTHAGSFVSAYEATGEEKYLTTAKRHVDKLYANYRQWHGCFGLWSTDLWLRDSTLFAFGVPLAQVAPYYDDARRRQLLDQVAHQYLTTVKYMRDERTGLYRFGGRDGQQCPTLYGHGSQWQAMAFSSILGHFPKEHPAFGAMADAFRDLMAAAVKYQDADGFWHTVFPKMDDTYGNMLYTPAMTGALYRGLAFGVLDESFAPHARRGFDAFKLRAWDGHLVGRGGGTQVSKNPLYFNARAVSLSFEACSTYPLFCVVEKARYEKPRGAAA